MKKLSAVSLMLFLILGFTGCGEKKVDTENLKEVATHVVGDVAIVLLNSTGELKQGQNEFVVQFRDHKGQPASTWAAPSWLQVCLCRVGVRCLVTGNAPHPASRVRLA